MTLRRSEGNADHRSVHAPRREDFLMAVFEKRAGVTGIIEHELGVSDLVNDFQTGAEESQAPTLTQHSLQKESSPGMAS
jgi:hypothetical protein